MIQSIVKLPPLDERTFDSPSGAPLDEDRLLLQAEMDSLYRPEAVNEAEAAQERQLSRKKAKEAAAADEAAKQSDKNEEAK